MMARKIADKFKFKKDAKKGNGITVLRTEKIIESDKNTLVIAIFFTIKVFSFVAFFALNFTTIPLLYILYIS